MGFDQEGNVVFRVVPGENNKWNVNEEGFAKPLASFDTEKDAVRYAHDLARSKAGSSVIVEGDTPG